jgi:hypothetical protein
MCDRILGYCATDQSRLRHAHNSSLSSYPITKLKHVFITIDEGDVDEVSASK